MTSGSLVDEGVPHRSMCIRLVPLVVLASVWLAPAVATAQPVNVDTPRSAELAREFVDPLTTLPQIFTQDAYTPSNYGTEAPTNRLIARAIIPRIPRFSLMPVQLIRPSIQLVTVPTGRGTATTTAFGDVQLFDFAVMPWPDRERTGLLMGAGPVFVFPTATDKLAGQGAWQVGPGFAAVYKGIPAVILGALIQNPISFAYTSGDRQPVSALLVQPIVLAYIWRGFYVKSADATWAINWHHNTPTVLPLSFGIGHVRVHEGWPPINVSVSGEWTVYRQFAPVAPQTTVRFQLTVAFPEWRPWG